MFDKDDGIQYRVVLNHEAQYSMWPADRELPDGWKQEGTVGTLEECVEYIDQAWTDLRPLSLRRRMEADQET